jgi:hypothetical protein
MASARKRNGSEIVTEMGPARGQLAAANADAGSPPRLPAPPPRAPPNGTWTWELAAGDPSGAAAVAKA